MVETGSRVGPEASGTVGNTFVEIQVNYVNGVDVSASGAVSAGEIASSTVHIAEPTLELGEIFILPVWTVYQTVSCSIL
jgi:hypothetical protein